MYHLMDFFQVIFEIVNIKRFETKKYFFVHFTPIMY